MIEEKDEIDLFLDSQVKTEEELLQEKCERIYYVASSQIRRDICERFAFSEKEKKSSLKKLALMK